VKRVGDPHKTRQCERSVRILDRVTSG
jgi:hypothetical protein